MNVLILHGSCRVNGVTGQLADEFAHGVKDAGHHVTKVEQGIADHEFYHYDTMIHRLR